MSSSLELLDIIAARSYVAWRNTLSGSQSTDQKRYFERMNNPEVGDLVLEITNFKAPSIDRIGRLLEIGPDKFGLAYVIETFDGREFRWSNSDFIVIPETPFHHQAK